MYKVIEGLYKDGKIVLPRLPDVKERTNKYREQLTRASEKEREGKTGRSPFFSSLPVDIGYTDAGMLDKIISGEQADGNIS